KTTPGLIPNITMSFQMVRELSEADRAAIDRDLDIDEKYYSGTIEQIRRQIIRTLVRTSASGESRVSKLNVSVLPYPSVDFTIVPNEKPLPDDLQALLYAIKSQCAALGRRVH